MINIDLIAKISDAFGPSGFEEDVARIIIDNAGEYPVKKDYMQNVYMNLPSGENKLPVIMLDAHTDEVGFMVHSIMDNGLIKIVPLGGWVDTNVPAHLFVIKNSQGELHRAVSTSKPPHFTSQEEISRPLNSHRDIQLDLGVVSRNQVLDIFKIQVGDPVMPDVTFNYNEKTGIMFGKAFDCRLGVVCILEVMKRLEKEKLPVHVTGAFATQEEVGLRGALVTAKTVKPSFNITFEGSPADDLYFDKFSTQGALMGGAQIRHRDAGMISSPAFIRYAKEVCVKYNIKAQYTVRTSGSTNSGAIHTQNEGCPCLVIGIPSRYVHTHYGYAHIDDMEAAVSLAVEVIKNLTAEKIKEVFEQ